MSTKRVLDKAIKMMDENAASALKNFRKVAEFGDSIKINIKNKQAIVQKEADGWYISYNGKRMKGSFNIILGYINDLSK